MGSVTEEANIEAITKGAGNCLHVHRHTKDLSQKGNSEAVEDTGAHSLFHLQVFVFETSVPP
jgi:hypothetical protein